MWRLSQNRKGVSEGESQRYVLRVDRGRVTQCFAGHCTGFNYIRVQEMRPIPENLKQRDMGVFRKERKDKQSSNFIMIYSWGVCLFAFCTEILKLWNLAEWWYSISCLIDWVLPYCFEVTKPVLTCFAGA